MFNLDFNVGQASRLSQLYILRPELLSMPISLEIAISLAITLHDIQKQKHNVIIFHKLQCLAAKEQLMLSE